MRECLEARYHVHPRLGDGPYPALVLADSGSDMWLATIHFDEPPGPRTTFHFLGEVWEVVWSEEFGCRAEPAVM